MSAPSPEIVATRWWWVRHAPVPDGGCIYGQRDLDCDCSNESVFRAVAAILPAKSVWVTSALKRAKQTAAAIQAASAGKHAPTEMEAFSSLNEQHLGDWQGQNRDAFRIARGTTAMDFWLTKGDERPPGGESYHDLVERVVSTIGDLNRRYAGHDIISVTHGGTIRAAIGLALNVEPTIAHAFTIDNCSVTCLEHLARRKTPNGGVWRVGMVNDRPWVGPAAVATPANPSVLA